MNKTSLWLHLLIFPFITFHLHAQLKITWDKSGNGAWGVMGNWDCNCLPTILDTVYIEHDSVTIGSITAYAAQVTVGNASNMPTGLAIQDQGTLFIFGSTNQGLLVYGSQSSFRNNGVLDISNAEKEELRFEGLFFANHGTINIENSSVQTVMRVLEGSVFENHGHLGLSSTTNNIMVYNSGDLANDGELIINGGGTGIFNFSSSTTPAFTNHDSVSIRNVLSGIYNDGTFVNEITGVIHMDTIDGKGILNPGDLTNTGILRIHQTQGDGIDISSGGSFINQNLTSITRSGQDGANDGIENNGYFLNDLGAIVQIDTSLQHGFNNIDTVINSGTIQISEIGSIGYLNGNYFSNQGNISVERASTGFYNSLNSEAYNVGIIHLSNITTTPVSILLNSIFDNLLSGTITVED